MIKLKSEVNKSKIMRELKAEAEITFKNAWHKEMQIRAYMDGADDLLKKIRISQANSDCTGHKPIELRYLQWVDFAEEKTKRGEKQKQCPKCGLWFFREEF